MKWLRAAAPAVLLALAFPPAAAGAPDVAVVELVQPTDTVAPGYVVPRARVANLGDGADSVFAWFTVERPGGGFSESFSDTLVFPPPGWRVENVDGLAGEWGTGTGNPLTPPGCAVVNAEPGLQGNDDWLISPRVKVNPSDTLIFWYRALGVYPESLEVWVSLTDSAVGSFNRAIQAWDFDNEFWYVGWADFHTIGDTWVYIGFRYKAGPGRLRNGAALDDIRLRTALYADSARLLVAPGDTAPVSFASWRARLGRYVARCSTYQAGDVEPGNDALAREVAVVLPPPRPSDWAELAPVPAAPSGRAVKDGGWLVAAGGRFYAAKGYRTGDFYSFDPATGDWDERPKVGTGTPGPNEVGKGGCATFDGERYIYSPLGNKTKWFLRYDIEENVWLARAGIPDGPSNKTVRGGTDVAWVGRGGAARVYLLKGYATEFYRYNVDEDRWHALPNAPTGVKPKWDKGSWLVYDGERTLYAHKAKYPAGDRHELWAFDVDGDSWARERLPGMPLVGLHSGKPRSKKAKDGGCAVVHDGAIYALKGGGTQQFWRFSLDSLTWRELDTVPQLGSTGKKKRVKAGADIAPLGDGAFLALKGNKTRELWRYVTPAVPPDGGAAAGRGPAGAAGLAVGPNPARREATLRYELPAAGPASIRVYDAAGRAVLERGLAATRAGVVRLDLRGLPAGVYLVRLEAAGHAATRKLVVQQ